MTEHAGSGRIKGIFKNREIFYSSLTVVTVLAAVGLMGWGYFHPAIESDPAFIEASVSSYQPGNLPLTEMGLINKNLLFQRLKFLEQIETYSLFSQERNNFVVREYGDTPLDFSKNAENALKEVSLKAAEGLRNCVRSSEVQNLCTTPSSEGTPEFRSVNLGSDSGHLSIEFKYGDGVIRMEEIDQAKGPYFIANGNKAFEDAKVFDAKTGEYSLERTYFGCYKQPGNGFKISDCAGEEYKEIIK